MTMRRALISRTSVVVCERWREEIYSGGNDVLSSGRHLTEKRVQNRDRWVVSGYADPMWNERSKYNIFHLYIENSKISVQDEFIL